MRYSWIDAVLYLLVLFALIPLIGRLIESVILILDSMGQ